MIVESRKIASQKDNLEALDSSVAEYMESGVSYEVYGIRISGKTIYYTIFFEQRHLIEVSSELFEMRDNSVSPLWKMKISDNGDITFWPSLFYKADFFENFSEWEHKERDEFSRLEQLFRERNSLFKTEK